MIHTTFSIKQDTLYVTYAPEFELAAPPICDH